MEGGVGAGLLRCGLIIGCGWLGRDESGGEVKEEETPKKGTKPTKDRQAWGLTAADMCHACKGVGVGVDAWMLEDKAWEPKALSPPSPQKPCFSISSILPLLPSHNITPQRQA